MSIRDEVLAAVSDALSSRPAEVTVDRSYRVVPQSDDVLDLFCERVAEYRATVHQVSAETLADTLSTILAGASVVVPDGFDHPVTSAAWTVADDRLSAADLDLIDAVLTTATVGIAETGTLILDHGPGQGRRILSLVPDLHVCVITADQVVAGVPEAVARLDPRRPQTWISGPSATSDIELNRVEGVHGPRALHVVVIRDGATAK